MNVKHPKIQIVTHEEIFINKSHLPTFNSMAIECHLHRIKGLSKNFIYMNDDFLLGNYISRSDFKAGEFMKVRLSWEAPRRSEKEKDEKMDSFSHSLRYTGEFLDARYGVQKRYVPAHVKHPTEYLLMSSTK